MAIFQRAHAEGERSFALFDIGASSVAVALIYATPTEIRTLWERRLEFAYDRNDDYEHYQKSMYATLLDSAMAVMQDGVRVAELEQTFHARTMDISVVFAPPWFFASVESGTRPHETRRTISQRIVDELRADMFSHMLTRPEYLSWQDVAGQGDLLEQEDLRLVLDGYPVRQHSQYEASEVVLTSYLATIPQQVSAQVGDIVRRVFPNHQVRMHTSTRVFASYTATCESAGTRHLLVEVGGPITSVAVVEHGTLGSIATIPMGSHDILRACAPNALQVEEAASRAVDIAKQLAADPTVLTEEITQALNAWGEAVQSAVGVVTRGLTPPENAVLIVKENLHALFAHALATERVQPGTREPRAYNVKLCEAPNKSADMHGLGTRTDRRIHTLACAIRGLAT